MGQAENEIKKIIVPIHSNLTRNSEFQKNCKKYQKKKKKKHYYGLLSGQNEAGQAENEREKTYRSDPFEPNLK